MKIVEIPIYPPLTPDQPPFKGGLYVIIFVSLTAAVMLSIAVKGGLYVINRPLKAAFKGGLYVTCGLYSNAFQNFEIFNFEILKFDLFEIMNSEFSKFKFQSFKFQIFNFSNVYIVIYFFKLSNCQTCILLVFYVFPFGIYE